MGLLKRAILLPASLLQEKAIQDGRFTDRARRITRIVLGISVVTLVADPVLAIIRFGDVGLSHPAYYVAMLATTLTLAMVIRPNAETSLKEMKQSKNWIVRGGFFAVLAGLGIVVAGSAVVGALLSIVAGAADSSGAGNDDQPAHPPIGPDGQALSTTERNVMFMDDAAAPSSSII